MLKIGEKVKATCLDGDVFVGFLASVDIGIDPKNPTQACIFLNEWDEKKSKVPLADTSYGNVMIWCIGLSSIESTDLTPGLYPSDHPKAD